MSTTSTFNERLVIAIDSRRLDELRTVAKREELSIGAVVRRLIRELLEREENETSGRCEDDRQEALPNTSLERTRSVACELYD
jgi:hypothetical protein